MIRFLIKTCLSQARSIVFLKGGGGGNLIPKILTGKKKKGKIFESQNLENPNPGGGGT